MNKKTTNYITKDGRMIPIEDIEKGIQNKEKWALELEKEYNIFKNQNMDKSTEESINNWQKNRSEYLKLLPNPDVPVNDDLLKLWQTASLIGLDAKKDFLISFTTMFIAFNFVNNSVSSWLEKYSEKNKSKLILPPTEIRETIQILVETGNTPNSDFDPVLVEVPQLKNIYKKLRKKYKYLGYNSSSVKLIFEKSANYLSIIKNAIRDAGSPAMVAGNQYAVAGYGVPVVEPKHIMAVYLFDPGKGHEDQLKGWGYNVEAMKESFAEFIANTWPEEIEGWAKVDSVFEKYLPTSESSIKHLAEGTKSYDDIPEDTIDLLGRRPIANFLAERMLSLWRSINDQNHDGKEIPPFMIHLHGPWGSGKSTMLNFLEDALKTRPVITHPENLLVGYGSSQEWLILRFNAWRNKHIDPPWWSFLDSIISQTYKEMGFVDMIVQKISIFFKRLFRSEEYRFLLVTSLFFILALIVIPSGHFTMKKIFNNGAAEIKNIIPILAAFGSLWAYLAHIGKIFLPRTAAKAADFSQKKADPMFSIKQYFQLFIKEQNRPIAIFIDDLDRCGKDYSVDLLEGIQTLFGDPRVIYIVAADRRWLYSCFEQRYIEFKDKILEPGKTLGYLFLEKCFQFSIAVPGMNLQGRNEMWSKLIGVVKQSTREDIKGYEKEAFKEMQTKKNQEEMFASIETISDGETSSESTIRRQLKIEAAIEMMAKEKIEEQTEHFLSAFEPLVEPNPRSMKRLINAYGITRALALMSNVNLNVPDRPEQLALWTIMSLRWPRLETVLVKYDNLIYDIEANIDPIYLPNEDSDIRTLIKIDSVRNFFLTGVFIQSKNKTVKLDNNAIIEFKKLHDNAGSVA